MFFTPNNQIVAPYHDETAVYLARARSHFLSLSLSSTSSRDIEKPLILECGISLAKAGVMVNGCS